MSHDLDLLTDTLLEPSQDSFDELSRLLLERTYLMIAGVPHRLREIEFYVHGGDHPDPFAHCDPIQKSSGRWYFHRDGEGYRGGSFKGLDITFGSLDHFTGILIRSISRVSDDTFVNGCSLCVDHILKSTAHSGVAELDATINKRRVTDTSSPVHLAPASAPFNDTLYTSPRVGLTLKRVRDNPDMPAYIMRFYRSLNAPRLVKKGRLHLILALHEAGSSPDDINALTGSPKKSIEKYIKSYTEGLAMKGLRPFYYKSLKNDDLCRLHGAWRTHFG